MHSSELRGTDFEIIHNGISVSHQAFFKDHTVDRRIGVVAPNRVDAVGAATLIMACVTAFFDRYREAGEKFFAYPDYFAFQGAEPLASYAMLDIWPDHKSVATTGDHISRLNAINDRAVNVLILPEGGETQRDYEKPQMESARRNIKECYVYSPTGQSQNADTTIRCKKDPLHSWGVAVFDSLIKKGDESVLPMRKEWEDRHQHSVTLEQAYRHISLDQALALL